MTEEAEPNMTSDRRHLEPGWVAPWAHRPPRQRWANWVRGWRPVSAQGKAAKAYSRAQLAPLNWTLRAEQQLREYKRTKQKGLHELDAVMAVYMKRYAES